MKSYEKILKSIWCSDSQIALFLLLRKYGAKPASTLAKLVGAERTHVYKMLQQMLGRWIIAQSQQHGIQSFYIPSQTIFDQYYSSQQSLIDQSKAELPQVYEELAELWSQGMGRKPLYRIREGHDGMKQMFQVMKEQLIHDTISVVKIISMSTLETSATTPQSLQEYASHFFRHCKDNAISVQTMLATGVMIPEQIISLSDIDELSQLPAGQSSLYVFVIGKATYFIVFKDIPLGFRRELVELADLFHFILKIQKET